MSNGPTRRNGTHSGPTNFTLDPLKPFYQQAQTFKTALGLIFDDPEQFMNDLCKEIIDTPADERFTSSVYIVKQHVEAEFGDVGAFVSQLPVQNQEGYAELMEGSISALLDTVLRGVLQEPDPEDYLIVSAALQAILDAVQASEATEDADGELLGSSLMALYARFYSLVKLDRDVNKKEIVRDVARGLYFSHKAYDETYFEPHPDELSYDIVETAVIQYGATAAYRHLDISVSRGAEIAHMEHDDFRELLGQHGIALDWGPESKDDLFGSELTYE